MNLKKLIIVLTITIVVGSIVNSCKEEFPDMTGQNNILKQTTTIGTISGNSVEVACAFENFDSNLFSEVGFCWGLVNNPTTNDNKVNQTVTYDSFSTTITNLASGTKYYLRSFAIHDHKPVYGTILSFTTRDGIPIITTNTISEITSSSAQSGGEIIDDGGLSITTSGIVWNTSQNPTVDNSIGMTNDGSSASVYTSYLINLIPVTTYYVRAYATNSQGTVYGNQENFKTKIADGTPGNDVTYNGYTYSTIYIDEILWFAENLQTTKYNNGVNIPHVTDNNTWVYTTGAAYCWNNNDEITYRDLYGALYNWQTINTGRLCPTGWHVPTDEEWSMLIDYIGENAGTKLKASSGWLNNGNGTDIFGFSALPGGYRTMVGGYGGVFFEDGYVGRWWSSTLNSDNKAIFREMKSGNTYVGRRSYSNNSGHSVRCVQDSE